MTLSLSEDVALYLRSQDNASAVVGEAVEEYRARLLDRELEAAYRAGAAESASLAEEWEGADPPLDA